MFAAPAQRPGTAVDQPGGFEELEVVTDGATTTWLIWPMRSCTRLLVT
jgi:hypothetical protein